MKLLCTFFCGGANQLAFSTARINLHTIAPSPRGRGGCDGFVEITATITSLAGNPTFTEGAINVM